MKVRRHMPIGFPNFVDEIFTSLDFSPVSTGKYPAINILEGDDQYGIEMIAPGFTKDQFTLKVENDHVIISAKVPTEETKTEGSVEKGKYTTREFKPTAFERSFALPKGKIQEEDIKAAYENGILKVVLPKREEAKPKSPMQIEIA